MNLATDSAGDLATARAKLNERRFDLCLTDMRLPDGDGLDLVAWIQELHADVPVAVITAHGNVESAVRALKLGAFDFVSKPLDLGVLRKLVAKAIKLGDRRGDRDARVRRTLRGCSGIHRPWRHCANWWRGSRAARRRCTSPGSPAPARSWSRG